MNLTLAGTIERRLLVNYRADPDHVVAELPDGFKPQLVNGHAIVGICIIRLRTHLVGLPSFTSLRSSNGAHRISVLDPHGRQAVYICRRDTASPVVQHLGGRIFPAHHHRANVRFAEHGDALHVSLRSRDGSTHVDVRATRATALPAGSAFDDVEDASRLFRDAPVGYSPNARADALDAVELRTADWSVSPMRLDHVTSSYFDDVRRFPTGSVQPDHALLMTEIGHTWHAVSTAPSALRRSGHVGPSITPA